ncbi:hypothetical protein [Polaribacter sp.]|uniref:hypothetical protein n=1 Tax=Polaribacter sp. TaxID=1920175 RepID=UPI003EF65001
MKNKLLTLAFALIISIVNAQCPDAKSNEYKNKAEQYGDTSYSLLATYFLYKCECKNGTENPEQIKQYIDALVDQYNNIKDASQNSNGIEIEGQHKVQWITISKEPKCTKSNNSLNNKDSSNNSSIGSNTSNSNTKSNLNQALNQSTDIVNDLIQGNENQAGNKSVIMGLEGVIEGNSEKVVGGLALGLVSLFSKSKARNNKPLTVEEIERIQRLDKNRYNTILKQGIKDSFNKGGITMVSDTSLVKVVGDKKVFMTFRPITDHTKIFVNSRYVYNTISKELEEENIYKEHYSNSKAKLVKINNYKKGFSRLVVNDIYENSLKVTDLISDEILFDKNNSKEEIIYDAKEREIGKRIIYNNKVYKEKFYNNDILFKIKTYNKGIIETEVDVVFVGGAKIPTTIIDYDNRGQKLKKLYNSYDDLLKSNCKITYYNNGTPEKTVTYKNGFISKEISH